MGVAGAAASVLNADPEGAAPVVAAAGAGLLTVELPVVPGGGGGGTLFGATQVPTLQVNPVAHTCACGAPHRCCSTCHAGPSGGGHCIAALDTEPDGQQNFICEG